MIFISYNWLYSSIHLHSSARVNEWSKTAHNSIKLKIIFWRNHVILGRNNQIWIHTACTAVYVVHHKNCYAWNCQNNLKSLNTSSIWETFSSIRYRIKNLWNQLQIFVWWRTIERVVERWSKYKCVRSFTELWSTIFSNFWNECTIIVMIQHRHYTTSICV